MNGCKYPSEKSTTALRSTKTIHIAAKAHSYGSCLLQASKLKLEHDSSNINVIIS